ncbi:DNA cytosine methyltransferase [Lysobacter sp. ESA13C]|uniref:DNA cytosine methyltransferase n=1 Tax=Lysobacter sp. ESA13C TaxID=2862676 RepID=UPI001CC021D9|nr:DNA cytosine methyltransferase [Lysobacter sp. ESA13C]
MADGSHSLALPFDRELVVDLFAGGGGASLGIGRAYREPDVAVNHNPVAIAVHRANHPKTEHFTCDVFEIDPLHATRGRPVGVLWASPDCRHHSKAKGGKPRSKKIRGLAWVVVKWAAICKPRLIHLENVEEFADWGPLLKDGSPCKVRKGSTFRKWVRDLEKLGYRVEWRERVAADAGAPTIRKRLYIIARRDGRPIVWPAATYGKPDSVGVRAGKLKPWRTAAECIDFGLPACSIFADPTEAKAFKCAHRLKQSPKRPLKSNTMRRIAKGLWRHVFSAPEPFIVPIQHYGRGDRSYPVSESSRTVTAYPMGGAFALAAPVVASLRGTSDAHLSAGSAAAPATTIMAQGTHHALGAATLVNLAHGEGRPGAAQRWGDGTIAPRGPMNTATGSGGQAIAVAHVAKFRGTSAGTPGNAPLPTITAGGDMARPAGAAHALGVVSAHLTAFGQNAVGGALDDPAQTALAGAVRYGLVAAHVTPLTHQGERTGHDGNEPFRAVTGAHRGEQALVSAFLEQANGGYYDGDGRELRAPASTVCASGSHQQLVAAYFVKFYSQGGQWQDASDPMHTVPTKDRLGLVQVVQVSADVLPPELRARARQVAAFLHEYLPEHFPQPADLVLLGDYVMVDVTLRMLIPRELARAQGFPDDYIIERGLFEDETTGALYWKAITKTDQVKLIGNSVCPAEAEALIAANAADLIRFYAREAKAA